MTDAPVAQLAGVWKRYARRDRWILQDVDLLVPAGVVQVVTGGNGDGKSTLLRIVAGLSSPSRGQSRRRPRSVAYLPERLPVELRTSARQYLTQMARLRGADHVRVLGQSVTVLERLGLSSGLDRPIRSLSKGNRQKVLLAQALGAGTALVVLDEPFSGLDTGAATELRTLLSEAREVGSSMLISAHHPTVLPDADLVQVLVDGRLRSADGIGPVTRLVLRVVRPPASSSILGGLPGVLSVRSDAGSGHLVVLTGDPDGLLATALGQGWSFVEGGPESIGPESGRLDRGPR
jgi:ABC-type multidrug transport system ATPase subunit